jgi:arabinan endo-1,5-alpha-L-arabinosidase
MQSKSGRPVMVSPVFCLVLALSLSLFSCGGGGGSPITPTQPPVQPPAAATTYSNPILAQVAGGGRVESCADPSIIHNDADGYWYAFCTGDPLNDQDKDNSGNWRFRGMPILRSADLSAWTYIGDVFAVKPSWVSAQGGLWAPAIKNFNGKFYLYYAASATNLAGGGSAIGVATSNSPAGPWSDSGGTVVEPGARATIDPEVVDDNGQTYIYYGSFDGGIHVRTLSSDGLHSDIASDQLIALSDRYEAPNIIKHGGYYYLFVSAANCCNGPLTGYNVFVGRSASALGPFVDKDGISFLDSRIGGTLVLGMNGNRWVGPGHNAVFTDMGGQDWTIYHAIDRNQPYFAGAAGFTKRPLMIDAIDWVNEWPVVRGGNWASDSIQPKPAAKAGEKSSYTSSRAVDYQPGQANPSLSDEFNAAALASQWSWIRQPSASTFRLDGAALQIDTQSTELYGSANNAGLLLEPTPSTDYMVETRMRLSVPSAGCCQNFAQAGLVIYKDDDNYMKLVVVSIGSTRQIEFGKEMSPVLPGYPFYGNSVLGPPGDWTWLRIVKRTVSGAETYTAYSSRDGQNWARGSTWTHSLGSNARIGITSMSAAGFTATFDYVHVTALAN